MRQQHRAHRPRRRQPRVGGDRRLDQGGGGLPPPVRLIGRQLGAGDGLHQPVHQHQPVPRRGDQRIPAQRGDRIPRRHRIPQQAPDRGRHLRTEPARSPVTGEQHRQRHRLGRQERQQPHQPRRRRSLACQPRQRQPQRRRHVRVPGHLPAGQQIRLPVPEQQQIPGQRRPGGLQVRGGLLQRQRQPAQQPGQLPAATRSASPVRDTRKSAATTGSSTGTSTAWPGGQIWFCVVISTRPGPAGGTNGATDARSGALSNTTSHPAFIRASTPCTDATGSRASAASRAPSCAASTPNSAASTAGSSAANCQHTSTSARCRCAYSIATLVLPAPPSPYSTATRGPPPSAGQPGVQLRQQRLPPGQEHRPRRHPQHQTRLPAGPLLLPLIQLGQLTLHAGAQPLHQALQVTELRRPHRSRHLLPERRHQRRPRRILQIRQPHIRHAGAQQRHPRDPGFPGPPELQLRNRQPLRIIRWQGWNPYRCPAISTYRSQAATSSRQLSRTVSLSGR